MKKTILGSVSIFALALTAPAMAQSVGEPTPPATPTTAPATTDCPAGTNNCSLVEQDGTDLEVTVDQTGSGNISDVDQINGSVGTAGDVEVDIDQTGTNARSYVLQSETGIAGFETRATVNQSGDGAESIILQDQARNASTSVTQDGASDSFVSQSGAIGGGNGFVNIDQRGGIDNDSVVFQLGHRDFGTTVNQDGNLNNSEVYQGDFSPNEDLTRGQRTNVDQTGDRNDSFVSQTILQSGANRDSIVTIEQDGDDNESSVVQTGNRVNHDVTIDQNGNDNLSRVVQNDFGTVDVGGSQVIVEQNDDGNDSFVDQRSGSSSRAQVTQTSTDTSGMVTGTDRFNVLDSAPDGSNDVFDSVRANFSNVVQSGDGITDATVSQTGFGNRSYLRQDNPTAATTAIATATQEATLQNSDIQQLSFGFIQVRQGITDPTSSNNDSLVIQADDASTVFVEQLNSNNISQVEQAVGGGGNFASVFQRGLGGFSGVEQTGNGNFAELTQGDLSEDSVSLIVQNGDTNIADVDQTGVGDFSSVSQTGIGNTATVNQGP